MSFWKPTCFQVDMQKFHANIFRAAVILLISGSAFITPARANTITLDWVGPNGNNAGGYYISPYTAQIDGTNQSLLIYCIDFNHDIAPPYQWEANIAPLTSNVSSFQYGTTDPNAALDYQAAAWLISDLYNLTQGTKTSANPSWDEAVDQYAAWGIFVDSAHQGTYNNSLASLGPWFDYAVNSQRGAAFNQVQTPGYQPTLQWDVVTPNPIDSAQEFLTLGDQTGFSPVATPEPVSIFLLGTALFGCVLVARRVQRKRAVSQ